MDANSLLSMNLALNVARKCRICGMDILDLTCAFPIFGNERLDRKIERYLQLNVQMDDLLPKCVCGSCYLKLESIDQFALMANRTEEAFRSWIGRLRGLTCPTEETKNVNILLPLLRPEPVGSGDAKKANIVIPPKDSQTSLSPTLSSANPVGGAPPEKGIISYSDLKLGLLIKDQELLKLILKALKWAENDRRASFDVLIQRLKNSSFREILSNRNLLSDSDLTQLLQSYIGQGVMNSFAPVPSTGVTLNNNIAPSVLLQTASVQPSISELNKVKLTVPSSSSNAGTVSSAGTLPSGTGAANDFGIDEGNVTQMEVGVDPDLYLPYDDEDSNSTTKFDARLEERQENMVTIKLVTTNVAGDMIENKRMIPAILNVRGNKRFQCSACPECFATNGELQQHIVTRHLPRTSRTVITEQGKPAIKIRVRKNKPLVPLNATTMTTGSSSSPSHTTPSPTVTPVENVTPPSESPIRIVPLKIPASTTITVVPCKVEPEKIPTERAPVSDPPKETKPLVESTPKVDQLLVRKSKRKPSIKLEFSPLPAEKPKKRKAKKVEQSIEQPPKAPRKATTSVCTVCRKKLAARETIREHMEREHSRYECEKCDRAFKSAINLARHQQYHASMTGTTTSATKGGSVRTPKSEVPKPEEPTFKCSQCEKAFRRSHHLKLHLIHHAKESAPRVMAAKPTVGNSLRKRTKLTSAISNVEEIETVRSRKSEKKTRKSAINRKLRITS